MDTDTQIDYEVFGPDSGTPLLISTGTGLSWGIWGELAKVFAADGYRVICYDHRGIGASSRGTAEITTRALAADARALLDALGVGRAHVLGWSLGSCVAQELALAHPERVASLVLCNTWHRTSVYQRALFTPIRHLWSTGQAELAWSALTALCFSPELLDGPAFDATMAMVAPALPSTRAHEQTVAEQWSADLAHDSADRLALISCPSLVVAGEQDLVTPAWQSEAVADLIPGAETAKLRGPGASHALAWERADEFVRTVGGFLARHR
ncbi:alpha/beta hydrolase [Streptomyces sp. NPDC048279]|uniref:alpha/beta fold hydrolase n=1 Tax=Streptomyces sp. NPDC048279 TaxID=3154714 RepID=UPI003430DDAE